MSKKFIDLANLKSNLENFFSEIISPTFATKEGVSSQLGNHTVKSDVPENAVFTDTIYDDTEVQKRISDNGYGELAGGKNLANPKNFINEKVVDVNTGGILNNNSYFVSGYIEVSPNITYTKQGFTSTSEHYFYDKDKNPIKGFMADTFIPPENAKYVVLSGIMGNQEIAQLEKGSVATEYEPYFPSNKMLAEENAQQNNSLTSLGKCKNLLKPTLQTTTQNGVTCTNNGDGTYTLNGTASGLTTFILRDMKLDSSLSYKLTGCPLGGDWDNGYSMYVEKQYWGIDVGKGYEITLTDASNLCGVYIRIIKDTVCNNLVFKPMLTTNLDATYDDFVPYTGDGDTLTHDVANVKNDLNNYALKSLYGDTTINVGRLAGSAVGNHSTAEGGYTTASGDYSHAEGDYTTASGMTSHAEGINTTAFGSASHGEGGNTTASGDYSHVEGNETLASGSASHAEGFKTTASNSYSHAEGISGNIITKIISGYSTSTSNDDILSAWKIKKFSVAHGTYSHVEGGNCLALGSASHAEGMDTTASGDYSHAEGYYATASGGYSHAEGYHTTASNSMSHVSGKFNAAMTTGTTNSNTTGTAFVIGNGTRSTALSNAFSVQFDGTVKAKSTITASTTADYAEFFEWLDKNPNEEDRVGHFVTLDGDKIKIATSEDDYILGIVSGEPFVLGNGDCDTWNGMFLHDEFRRTMYEPAPKMIEILDSEGNPTGEYEEVEGEYEGTRPVLNPDYDPTQEYISRFDRTEWSPVGMLGVLAVLHDGTAEVNGYVTVNNEGIATKCTRDTGNSYRVIKKVSDKVVEVIFK